MTRSTTTDDDFETLLKGVVQHAQVCRPRVDVFLGEGGLIFQAAKPPFYLRHYLTFIGLRAGGLGVVQSILKNMEREIAQAQRDAAEALTMGAA